MTDSQLRSAFEPPTDPEDIPAWLDAQERRLADLIADVATGIVRAAYRDYLDTLLPDTEPGAITAAGDLGALDSIPSRWAIAATGRIVPELNGLFLAGGIVAWTRSGGAPGMEPGGWADVVNRNAVDYMTTASNRLVGVGDNLWSGVRSLVTGAVEAGATNEDLKRNIEQMTRFSEFRADAVARTETIGAYVNGNNTGNLALGDQGPVEKWWLATLDDRARPDHIAAMPVAMGGRGEVIPYSATFTVGGVEMLHPHAPGAPAEQVVNCRCILMALYPGDERPDGTTVPDRAAAPSPSMTPAMPPGTPPSSAPVAPPVEAPAPPRRQYRRLRADSPEVLAVARKWDVDPSAVLQTRAHAQEIKRQIRQEARKVQRQAAGQIDLAQAHRIKSPGRNPSAEYDWFTGLDAKEKIRLRARWMRDDPYVMDPDEVADMMTRHVREFGSMDEAMEEWLRLTRVHDAAGAVGQGKVPVSRAYSGEINVKSLVGRFADTDIEIEALLVADELEAAAIVLRGEKDTLIRETRELLDAAVEPVVGPAPYRMSFISWFDELTDVEYDMRTLVDPPKALRRRYDELLPEAFADADATAEEVYARIVETARLADLEVSPNAIIPWAD